MNLKRIGRMLVCLMLVCCLIVQISPVKAEATSAGLAAAITGAASVSVSAPLVIGGSLIALGIMASSTNPLVFEGVVNDAVDSLTAAGTWIKDGTVELLRTVDDAGTAAYYVAGDMLEDLRSHMFTSGVLFNSSSDDPFLNFDTDSDPSTFSFSYAINLASQCDSYAIVRMKTGEMRVFYAGSSGAPVAGLPVYVSSDGKYLTTDNSKYRYYWSSNNGYLYSCGSLALTEIASYQIYAGGIVDVITSSLDLSLGSIPYAGAFIDGSSALDWAEEYARKALKVIEGGNNTDPDSEPPNDGKWFWPLALALSTGTLYAMSQADEWSGVTPPEFSDYTTSTEYEILDSPEVEVGTGLEISPVTSPDTGGDSGSESGGDSGSDSGSDTGDTDESTWFQRIVTGIEELPSKFQSWITDCKTAIEELPSKFVTWLDSIIEWLRKIWESLQELAQLIADKIRQVLISLFVPSEGFIEAKIIALAQRFSFADSIVRTAQSLRLGLAGVTTSPPIIYIDLGATRGSYNIGGKIPFIDMTWYAEYKPTVDALISSFLWICFVWRMLVHLPGIISGSSGLFSLGYMPSTVTSPIGAVKTDPAPGMNYSEMLDLYHQDLSDNPSWKSAFGYNPSFDTLRELYSSFDDDL